MAHLTVIEECLDKVTSVVRYRVDSPLDRRRAVMVLVSIAREKNLIPVKYSVSAVRSDGLWAQSYTHEYAPDESGAFCSCVFKDNANAAVVEFLYHEKRYAFGFVFSDNMATLIYMCDATAGNVAAVKKFAVSKCEKVL